MDVYTVAIVTKVKKGQGTQARMTDGRNVVTLVSVCNNVMKMDQFKTRYANSKTGVGRCTTATVVAMVWKLLCSKSIHFSLSLSILATLPQAHSKCMNTACLVSSGK